MARYAQMLTQAVDLHTIGRLSSEQIPAALEHEILLPIINEVAEHVAIPASPEKIRSNIERIKGLSANAIEIAQDFATHDDYIYNHHSLQQAKENPDRNTILLNSEPLLKIKNELLTLISRGEDAISKQNVTNQELLLRVDYAAHSEISKAAKKSAMMTIPRGEFSIKAMFDVSVLTHVEMGLLQMKPKEEDTLQLKNQRILVSGATNQRTRFSAFHGYDAYLFAHTHPGANAESAFKSAYYIQKDFLDNQLHRYPSQPDLEYLKNSGKSRGVIVSDKGAYVYSAKVSLNPQAQHELNEYRRLGNSTVFYPRSRQAFSQQQEAIIRLFKEHSLEKTLDAFNRVTTAYVDSVFNDKPLDRSIKTKPLESTCLSLMNRYGIQDTIKEVNTLAKLYLDHVQSTPKIKTGQRSFSDTKEKIIERKVNQSSSVDAEGTTNKQVKASRPSVRKT